MGVRSAKARALLCYLATTAVPRPRAELATLLWGERPDANARGSLRLALSELRKEVGGWLDVTREHVRLRAADGCFVDRRHLAQAPTVAEALRLWRGDFMAGISFCDAPAFAEWLECERRGVRLLLREVLLAAGKDEPAEQVVRLAHLVAGLDPYDEEAHRLLMTALARAGNRAGALACYDELRRRLTAELGVEPAPETRAVRQRLAPCAAPARRAPVPVPATHLIGRDADVGRLRALLARERLVTLVGPGGIGKTRLAMAAAVTSAPAETAFVSFAGVRPEAAVTTLARRLDVDLSPPRPALDLLLSALSARRRPLLLVLDNLEHLPALDQVIGELLRAAPALRVLATSRRRPDLPGQVTINVEGLSAPAAEALFAARAAVACPGFDPDREASLVAAICAATGGLPLAIELAAGLLRAVPCADLARHLDADLGLLAVPGPAARSRHACMRTVFETSWRLLDEAGRRALAALSVFGGGCTLDAALEVARTSPDVLVRLVDHSMIQLTLRPVRRPPPHPAVRRRPPDPRRTPRRPQAARRSLRPPARTARRRPPGRLGRRGHPRARRRAGQPQTRLGGVGTAPLPGALLDVVPAAAPVRGVGGRHAPPPRPYGGGTPAPGPPPVDGRNQRAPARQGTRGHPPGQGRTGDPGRAAPRVTPRPRRRDAGRRCPPARPPAAPAPPHPRGTRGRTGADHAGPPRLPPAGPADDARRLLRQLNAAERAGDTPRLDPDKPGNAAQATHPDASGDAALRAEAYANAATIARVAGRHRLANRYGTLADRALANVEHAAEAAHRTHLARGLDHLYTGAFEAARHAFAECRARTLAPRVAENCSGLLAETALWQGRFETAAELFAATAEQAAGRLGGNDIARHWCLLGQAEAMLRLDPAPPQHLQQVLAAARTSIERRRSQEKQLGLRDGPAMRTIQDMRLLTATARLHTLERGTADGTARQALTDVLALAGRLPSAHRGMLECWSGLAGLLWSLAPGRTSSRPPASSTPT
ncbi:ATP-binding protein [Nonomuraea rubra]|uniref:ATP-binding protein n=1 Tax=Nonomuraea rubra TaxID=46180 RepID=UPI00361304D1